MHLRAPKKSEMEKAAMSNDVEIWTSGVQTTRKTSPSNVLTFMICYQSFIAQQEWYNRRHESVRESISQACGTYRKYDEGF